MVWDGLSDQIAEMQQIRAIGISWIREDFAWDLTEPTPGVFDWSRIDQLMTAAATTGMHIVGIVDYSAPWSSTDPTGQGNKFYPPRPQDYAAYAQAIALRYGPGGVFWQSHPLLPADPIAALEIWNEPYGHWYWKPEPNPAAYAYLVRSAALAVHAVSPSLPILASGQLLAARADGVIAPWLSAVLAADPALPTLIAGWAVHPYPSPKALGPYVTGPDPRFTFQSVALAESTMTSLNAARPIWITEIGWSTASGTADGVTESQQGTNLTDALRRAFLEWHYVAHVFLYTWDKSTGLPGDLLGNYGVRRADGSPKPALLAIKSLLMG